MFRQFVLTLLALAAPALATAQLQTQAPPVGYSGELVAFTDDSVTLTDKDGKAVVVAMTRGWTVSRPRSVAATALKSGDFVATANRPVDEHTGTATELRILEPGYRPEYGTHMMAQTTTAMTHGTVAAASRTQVGLELEVTYPGGSRHLIVPNDVKITNYELLSRDVLKPGTKIGAVARKGEDGVLRAGRVTLPP